MKTLKLLLLPILLVFFSSYSFAQTVITPSVTVSQVNNGTGGGPLGRSGGVTFTFTKNSGVFDPCTYWGFQAGTSGDIATNMSNLGPCTFSGSQYYSYSSGDGTNSITLTGSSLVRGYTSSGFSTSRTVSQRATVTTSTGTFKLLSGDIYLDVSGLSTFSITVSMEGYGPNMGYNSTSYINQWRPLVQLYDAISTNNSYNVCTSFDSDFYAYSELAVSAITGGTTPICSGSSTGILTANYSNGSSNIGFQWYANGTMVPGATSSTFNAPAITTATTYRVDVTDSCLAHAGYSRTVSSPNFMVTLTPGTITPGSSTPDQALCYNGSPDHVYVSGYAGGTISKWEVDDNTSFSSPTDITSTADSVTGAQILVAAGGTITANQYVRAVITGSGCSAGSAYATIFVNSPNNVTSVEDTANCNIDGTGSWIHFYNKNTRNMMASINSNGQNLGNTEIKVYQHGGNAIFANTANNCLTEHAVMNRSFVIDVANAPTNSVSIRLYFTDAELAELIDSSLSTHSTSGATSFGLNDPGPCENDDDVLSISDLLVTQVSGAVNENGTFDPNDGDFILHTTSNGGTGNATYGANYIEFTVDSFSEFWIHGSETLSPLPLDLLNFKATLFSANQVAIDWKTNNEIDLSHFVIERSMSANGGFNIIHETKAVGSANSLQSYQHIDNVSQGGRYYYRLKSIDNDGTTAVSAIQSIEINTTQERIQVSPNPSKDVIKVKIDDTELYTYTIIDATGRTILTGNVTNQSEIDAKSIPAGTYTMQFRSYGTLVQTIKLSIVK
jgi:hypothetical protein